MLLMIGGLTALFGGALVLASAAGGAESVTGVPGKIAMGISTAGMCIVVVGLITGL